MNAQHFFDLLVERGVMPEIQVKNLREQVADAAGPVHPVFIARRLVQEGYLSSYFAKTLLAECGHEAAGNSNGQPAPVEEMTLEPIEEEAHPAQAPANFQLELAPLEEPVWMTAFGDDPASMPTGRPLQQSRGISLHRLHKVNGLGEVNRLVWLVAAGLLLVIVLFGYILLS